MNTQTTRRALIGGAGLAAAVAVVPAIGAHSTITGNDTELLARWNSRLRGRRVDLHRGYCHCIAGEGGGAGKRQPRPCPCA